MAISHAELVTILEGLGASGITTGVVTILSGRLSAGKQKQAEPNGARHRLQDEVMWLRQQLAVEKMHAAVDKARTAKAAERDPESGTPQA